MYRSQLRPKEWTRVPIYGDNKDEIVDCLWKIAVVKIERQVFFEDDNPKWSENNQPTVSDAGEFITLQDTSKKFYAIETLTARILRGWKDKTVRVYVYVWSISVETQAHHQAIQRKLLSPQNPDRSGAHSVRDDSALAEELRSKHSHLKGHYSSWLLWANVINSSPAHKQDEMRNAAASPVQLSKYFRWVTSSDPSRLEAVHREMIVAQNNNSGWLRDIGNINNLLMDAKQSTEGALSKIHDLANRGLVGAEMFNSMEFAVRPEEMELSQSLASRVTDCEDVDHR